MKSPIQYLKPLMRSERGWKIFLALAFTIPIILVLPHARSFVVRNAVTTTYLSNLNAPISGQVTDIEVFPGAVSQAGTAVVSIHNDRVDESRLARLRVINAEGQAQVERVRKLFADGLLSQADLETSEAIYESAMADFSGIELERKRLEQQLSKISQAVFQVDTPDGA